MTKGSWAATDADSVIVAADTYRGEIAIQHLSGDAMYIAFGEAAVVGEGILISSTAAFIRISDHRARLAIHAICDTGESASGGYQTG